LREELGVELVADVHWRVVQLQGNREELLRRLVPLKPPLVERVLCSKKVWDKEQDSHVSQAFNLPIRRSIRLRVRG
jgi:hypothetical protein